MTLANDSNEIEYTGDSSRVDFAFPYKYYDEDDLLVILRTVATGVEVTLTIDDDYTVSGDGAVEEGVVTTVATYSSSYEIVIRRNSYPAQLHNFRSQGVLSMQSLELALDKLAAHIADAQLRDEYEFAEVRAELADEIDTLRAEVTLDPGVDINASTVTATGSTTARTLAARFAQTYNVHDYGAVGDGSTNDYTAIQAAMTAAKAAGGGIVEFKNLTYKINSPLTLTSGHGVVLRGQGYSTVISLLTGQASAVSFITSNKIGIENIRFTANPAGPVISLQSVALNSWVRNCWITGGSQATSGIYIYSCTDLFIEDNYITTVGNTSATGTADINSYENSASNNSRLYIRRNYCNGVGSQRNIALYNTSYSIVEGNYCTGAECDSTTTLTGGHGIEIRKVSGTNFHNNIIRNNRVLSVAGSGIRSVDNLRTIVEGNTLINTVTALNTADLYEAAIDVQGANAIIRGNIVKTSGKAGIYTSGSYATVVENQIDDCATWGILFSSSYVSGNISNNIINDTQTGITNTSQADSGGGTVNTEYQINNNIITATRTTYAGVAIRNISYSKICGNIVKGCGGTGIFVNIGAQILFDGNICRDNSVAAANTYSGLLLSVITYCHITNNKSYNTIATGQKYGFEENGASDNNFVLNNYFVGNQTAGYLLVGASTYKDGNKIATGANSGSNVMVAGTVTVATNSILTGHVVEYQRSTLGGTAGNLSYAINTGVSIVFTSSDAADTSTIAWRIRQ